MNKIALIAVVAFLLNLPFGILRTRYPKLSVGWFLCIHAPIPIVVAIRLSTHTPFKYVPIFLATSIAGQVAGGRIALLRKGQR